MGTLKAYAVQDPHEDQGAIVLAESPSKAKSLLYSSGYLMVDVEFIDLRARRVPDADEFMTRNALPILRFEKPEEAELYRDLGWFLTEDDYGHICEACSRHPCGLEQYAVCYECCHCQDCAEICVVEGEEHCPNCQGGAE